MYRGPLILMQYALKHGKFLAFCIGDFITSLTQTHLFNCTCPSLVRPHLEYACPVWAPHLTKDIQAVESVQAFACKMATHNGPYYSAEKRF